MKKAVLLCLAAAFAASAQPSPSTVTRDQRLEWWREARFGLFIHWGLYSVPAGEWKGQPVAGIGEWIMNRAKIPVAEYEQLAKQFNPVKFDADKIVRMAKDAGMKYIVITSKHHDGFAMYHSTVSKYNIFDATPFHRDPMKELADACRREGIRLCFYYSQAQDWHEPNGAGNDWDFKPDAQKDFAQYFEAKAIPQVKELLTQYGPIGLIWFDTPRLITKEQSQRLADLVHSIQPMCIVSGRVGHDVGDYDSAGDNQISVGQMKRDWETPVTMNDTWGYKKDDHNWKPVNVLIKQLVAVASRGGNYLLNVGPTSEGEVPQPSVERLAAVGKWLRTNSEAVYGTHPSPFPYEQPWGIITSRPGKLYLHVFDWPSQPLTIYGIRSKVDRAYLLADAGHKALAVKQSAKKKIDHHSLIIQLPAAAPDANDSVIVLEVPQSLDVTTNILQQPDHTVTLNAYLGKIHEGAGGQHLSMDSRGTAQHWVNANDWMSWDFNVSRPGTFKVVALTSEQKYGRGWEGGHKVAIDVAGQKVQGAIEDNGKVENPSDPYWKLVQSNLGTVKLAKGGSYSLALKPQSIAGKRFGLTLVSVRLVPAE